MRSPIENLFALLQNTDRADFEPAAVQLSRIQMGEQIPQDELHPVVLQIRAIGASFGDVCAALVDRGYQNRGDLRFEHIMGALTTSDLGAALDTALTQNAQTRMADLMVDVTKLTKPISLNDFRPSNMPLADTGEFTPNTAEGSEVGMIDASMTGEDVQLWKDAKNFVISREAMLSSQRFDLMTAVFDALAMAASRAVARSISNLLSTNPTLKDGTAWFDSGKGNLLPANALSVESVSFAIQALNDQPTISSAGSDTPVPAGVKPKTLLVPPGEYMEAKSLISATALAGDDNLSIATLPELSGSWFLLGSAPMSAPIGYATLENNGPFSFARLDPKKIPGGVDGIPYRCRCEFGVAPQDRSIIQTPLS